MDRLNYWKESIESRLRELFKPSGPRLLVEAMSYYLFQEGKRIRPLFLCAITDALGGNLEDAITVGCAVEMIHNYSLIHDDLPAMDNDDFRRGMPSCHRKFGEAVAILAGDALLTYAFEVLSRKENFRSLNDSQILNIIRTIAFCSGSGGMVGGQVLDITEGAELEEINRMKTAALFKGVFLCGGIISGVEGMKLERIGSSGEKLGLLFQVTDDILDRDGFFKSLGEKDAFDHAKRLKEDILRDLEESIGSITPELAQLIDLVFKRII